jgi:flagellar biosynthetic protein FlhB
MFMPAMLRDLARALVAFIEYPHALPADAGGLQGALAKVFLDVGLAVAPVFAILMVAALAAGFVQAGFLIAPEVLMPKLSKLSPTNGLKRLFSVRALIDFAKSVLKFALVGAVSWIVIEPDIEGIDRFITLDIVSLLAAVGRMTVALFIGVLSVMTAIAAGDFLYERFAHMNRLRMSRQELRDEYKQSEGDPLIKSRLKQIRTERARRRMMQEVPKADVVITNPTHYAVALRYDQAAMAAPKVVAKGADLVARKIRELAVQHEVPIVENPPLARALFATVDIDREITPEHYRAVAEVISYVMKLKRARPVH